MDARFASCCLLSYNRPQFVRTAVESAVTKAEYPLEMIVHDDGSNPETVATLLELRDAGLISLLILNAEGHNEGQGIALNRMFMAAKGDPIVKLDHDLEFSGGWLRRCVELLEANRHVVGEHGAKAGFQPEIGALGLFKYHVDPVNWQEMILGTWTALLPEAGAIEWEEHQDFVGSAMVIPRRAFEEFGPFEERSPAFAEDAVFKHAIRDRGGWANALFPFDLAVNRGFGVGPSTVVVAGDDGPEPAKIHDGPKVL
jgi:glycosyltransferase involved in cell wall biosynthesis